MAPAARGIRSFLTALAALAAMLAGAVAPAAAQQLALPEAPAAEAPADPGPSIADALRLLAIVLDDPTARAALVEQLRAAEAAAPDAPDAPAPPAEEATIPQLIAEQAVSVAEDVAEGALDVLRSLLVIRDFVANAGNIDRADARSAILPALVVLVATFASLAALRVLARPPLRRLDARAAAAAPAQRYGWVFAAAAVETMVVLLAWVLGLGAALATFERGLVDPSQAHFLQAFLVAGLARVAVRIVFKPRRPHLRLFEMQETTARHWYFWLARIIGVLAYGLLFVAPLLAAFTAPGFVEWLELLIAVLAYVMAFVVIARNRRRVRVAMLERVARMREDIISSGLAVLAQIWHILALGYVTTLFVAWRAHPGDAERYMLGATAWSVLAIAGGVIVIALLTRAIVGGVTLSDGTRRSLPLLEARLNSVVPAVLQVLRILVAVLVVVTVLTIWGAVDFLAWVTGETGRSIFVSLSWVFGILLVASIAWILVASWIEYRLNPDVGRPPTARERTLLALFSNAFIIVLFVVTAMSVLNELGINIAPLIAGAGVVGLAIGFGSQQLVRDIINGAFIQFENTMNEGDVVTAGSITGVVEKLTIRSVSLRDLNGNYHMIPFSGVDTVTNFTKTFSFHVADMHVAYRENVTEVKEAMFEAFDRLMQSEHRAHILPPFEMFGVNEFAESAIVVRGRIKTLPGQQWAVGRAYNELVKDVFDARGIEIPFPHRTIYMGIDREGNAPPLNLRHGRAPRQPSPEPPAPDDRPGTGLAPPDAEIIPPASEDVT